MQNSIFTVELPFVETNEELEQIKKMYPKYDPYFIASGCCKKRREKFDKLWANYKPYADSHFLSQIKTNFHQRTWEMYVANVLLEKKFTIQSQNEGPDFIIDSVAYIECVAPTKGDPVQPDSVPEVLVATIPEEVHEQDVPVDRMILRITASIEEKASKQYKNWRRKKWFDEKKPFVIAINTSNLSYLEDPYMPNVLKALFGFQFMQINITTSTTNYSHRSVLPKLNSKPVPVNYFTCQKFDFVSGILFSNTSVLNHPENFGDDCFFVNNPFAKNPINDSFVKFFKNWTASKKNNKICLKRNY